jgi:glucosamine--fructose-6-phosphate aminotransferase (isomerizing)
MCGVVGYVGQQQALPLLLEGLRRLEYRGYDSSGVALQRGAKPKLAVFKRSGKLDNLTAALPSKVRATCGIGHTRWATHGEPSDVNAHPHTDAAARIAVVHNGILENAAELRARLQGDGVEFLSETDTEVLAHLIAEQQALLPEPDLTTAVRLSLKQVTGAYGILVIDARQPQTVVAARLGSPLLLGIGDKELFAASDVGALVRHTQQVIYLEEGDVATLTPQGYSITTMDAMDRQAVPVTIAAEAVSFDKNGFAHFTLKEIHEQVEVLQRVLSGRLDERFATARLDGLNLSAKDRLGVRRIKILGCGSAFIAASIGARTIERLARIPCDAEPAAEFRYRNPIIEEDTLYFAVSQSGETFDTLAAVQEVQRKGGTVLGVVNSVGSSIARACDGGLYLHAGAEIAVVSTKTFTATLTAFCLIGLYFARGRDLSHSDGAGVVQALQKLPEQVAQLLARSADYAVIAKQVARYDHAYFVGRNEGYFLAMEGSLKLKEISYIHAEAYAASELKHGPLALVSEATPTIALVPEDDLLAKNLSTIAEVQARKGPVWIVGQGAVPNETETLQVMSAHPVTTPILMSLPLQLLAYYVALERGCDVDQPRNLAKSVTVE